MAFWAGAKRLATQLPLKRGLLNQGQVILSHRLSAVNGSSGWMSLRALSSKPVPDEASTPEKSLVSKILDGTYPSFLSKASCTMTTDQVTDSTRWLVFPKVFLVQVPIGAIYAWSMWQGPLCQSIGVVTPALLDWSLGSVGFTFSCLAMGFGCSVGCLGPWIDRAGPRYASLVGATLFGGGYFTSALGAATHTLPLIWLGWGIMGGLGWGLGYMAPIVTLMKWFPDKKGTATGLCIGGFAGGSFIAAPSIDALRAKFFVPPVYVGAANEVQARSESGVQFVFHEGQWSEAVCATAPDIAKLPGHHASELLEGFYLVGTGNDGLMMTFATLGAAYTTSMMLGASLVKEPPAGWLPAGWTPPVQAAGVAKTGNVSTAMAMKTPQFYLMWLMLACNASAGVCVISSAKTMMGEIFASLHPGVVTASFTTGFVGALSLANASGRFCWSAVSDYIGRKNTYYICCMAGPACLMIPTLTNVAVSGTMGTTPLYIFYGTSFAIVTWYGGVLGMVPSYVADTFGTKNSGPIYGRIMTNWTFAAIGTPSMLSYLKGSSQKQAIDSLVATISPEAFEKTFGAPVSDLDMLVAAKSVSIGRLMELAPPGTVDPSPYLYDSTFYAMGGILGVAAVSNAMIRHMDPKFFMETQEAEAKKLAIDLCQEETVEEKEKEKEKKKGDDTLGGL